MKRLRYKSWKFLFAWYDLWVGFFWDKAKLRLYVLPLPCCGVVFQFCDPLGDDFWKRKADAAAECDRLFELHADEFVRSQQALEAGDLETFHACRNRCADLAGQHRSAVAALREIKP